MFPSREEGGAVADLLIVGQGQRHLATSRYLVPGILDLGLGKFQKSCLNCQHQQRV